MTLHLSKTTNVQEQKKSQRKVCKPLVERRRRARINASLVELRALLLPAQGHGTSRMEEADVLELAVRRLRGLKLAHSALPPSLGSDRTPTWLHPPPGAILWSLMGGSCFCSYSDITRPLAPTQTPAPPPRPVIPPPEHTLHPPGAPDSTLHPRVPMWRPW